MVSKLLRNWGRICNVDKLIVGLGYFRSDNLANRLIANEIL